MAASYCKPGDLYAYGLPRGAVQNPGRLAESVLASTDAITLDVHGFDADDVVMFRAEGAGGSLPSPLAEGIQYFAIPLTESTFKVAATAGGAAINLTTDGVRVVVIAPLPIAQAIDFASRIVDDLLPDHVVPLSEPYPSIVVMTTAELAASKLASRGGFTAPSLSVVTDAAQKRLARWAQGVPVRGANSPAARAGLAVTASAPVSDADGWRKFGGIC